MNETVIIIWLLWELCLWPWLAHKNDILFTINVFWLTELTAYIQMHKRNLRCAAWPWANFPSLAVFLVSLICDFCINGQQQTLALDTLAMHLRKKINIDNNNSIITAKLVFRMITGKSACYHPSTKCQHSALFNYACYSRQLDSSVYTTWLTMIWLVISCCSYVIYIIYQVTWLQPQLTISSYHVAKPNRMTDRLGWYNVQFNSWIMQITVSKNIPVALKQQLSLQAQNFQVALKCREQVVDHHF